MSGGSGDVGASGASPCQGAGGKLPERRCEGTAGQAAITPHAAATKGSGAAAEARTPGGGRAAEARPGERLPGRPRRQLRREARGRRGERAGRAQRHAEKGQRRRLLPASVRLITRSPLAADLQEQINQSARLDEICCYCAHF